MPSKAALRAITGVLAAVVLGVTLAGGTAGGGAVILGFGVAPEEDAVYGLDWPEGAEVTLTIDDPGIPGPVDYTDTQTVFVAPWDPEQTFFVFELQDVFDIQPGQTVTVSDGVTTKEHTATGLTVTEVDQEADTVSGTAEPGSDVDIATEVFGGGQQRHEVAGGAGQWTADFSTPGDEPGEEGIADIGPGVEGVARQFDDDEDWTAAFWRVPNPTLSARPAEDRIEGWEWPEGAEVTLTIDDLDTPEPVDYTDTQTAFVPPWDPQQTVVNFELQGVFDVEPGQVLSLSDGVTTKEHTVTSLTVTAVDPDADTVSGTAEPGSDVDVGVGDESGDAQRRELADGAGQWTADFSAPGDEPGEEGTFDIGPGTGGEASQQDDDGDRTAVGLEVANPTLSARPAEDRVEGWQWPEGAEVTLTIDDPGTPEPVDYTDTQTVSVAPWDPQQTYVAFELQGVFDVEPGQVLSLSDGVTTKEHTVTNLTVTALDPDADTVSGTADPGSEVEVMACDESGCVQRREVADGAGQWTADFSTHGDEPGEEDTFDIGPGTEGEASQQDDDGDRTAVSLGVPNPTLTARPAEDRIEGNEWPEGAEVTLTIDDPGTPEPVDYTDTQTVSVAPWDPQQTVVNFDLQGIFDVEPGQVVSLSDGITTKEHTVTNLTVTAVDPDADTVSGTADPGSDVDVGVGDESGGAQRREVADGAGQWTADFSTPGDEPGEEDIFDIGPGTGGEASQQDDDGDRTAVSLRVPNPILTARPAEDRVEGNEWPEGAEVTLTIDDPGTPEPVDYTDTQTVSVAPWDPQQTAVNFDLQGVFDVEPGQVVSLSDGVTTKEHTVTNLTVTAVYPGADIVSGTADPGSEVAVMACDESGCIQRRELADGAGQWTADFSAPGDEPGEEGTFDIVPGTGGEATQQDDDFDRTAVGLDVPPKQPAEDTDGDGCTDTQENGLDETLGGRRDYVNFWDFFDPNQDGSVTVLDFFALLQRFGAVGDTGLDPLSEPDPAPAYHTRFDRGGVIGPNAWNLGPPNGAITVTDFFALLVQFGHSCA